MTSGQFPEIHTIYGSEAEHQFDEMINIIESFKNNQNIFKDFTEQMISGQFPEYKLPLYTCFTICINE